MELAWIPKPLLRREEPKANRACVKIKLVCVKATGVLGFLVTTTQPNLGKDIKPTHKLIREQFNSDDYWVDRIRLND